MVGAAIMLLLQLHVSKAERPLDQGPQSHGITLVHEATYPLPDHPTKLAWSPDGRIIAFHGFRFGAVRLIEVATGKVADRKYGERGRAVIAWAPRGRLLATAYADGVHLYSVNDTDLHAFWKNTSDSCYILLDGVSILFSADGRELWVACQAGNSRDQISVAIKLDVPNLSYKDRIISDVPIKEKRTTSWAYSTSYRGGAPILVANFLSHFDDVPKHANPPWGQVRDHLGFWRLGKGQHGFIDLTDDPKHARYSSATTMLDDATAVVVYRPPDPEKRILVVDLTTKKTRWIPMEPGFALADFEVASRDNGRQLIVLAANYRKGTQGLRIIDTSTQRLLAQTGDVFFNVLALSPDEKRIAIASGSELKLYRIDP